MDWWKEQAKAAKPGDTLSVYDLKDALRFRHGHAQFEVNPPRILAHVDGFYAEGESDADDGAPLAVGDSVRWNWFKTRIGQGALPDRPYINGVVLHTDPKARGFGDDLNGSVYVKLSHGPGSWTPREQLKKGRGGVMMERCARIFEDCRELACCGQMHCEDGRCVDTTYDVTVVVRCRHDGAIARRDESDTSAGAIHEMLDRFGSDLVMSDWGNGDLVWDLPREEGEEQHQGTDEDDSTEEKRDEIL